MILAGSKHQVTIAVQNRFEKLWMAARRAWLYRVGKR